MAEELYKQPSESRLYHFVFSNLLVSGEAISSISSITQINYGKINGSTDLTLSDQSFSDDTVQVRILAGTQNESYKLTTIVITSNGNTLELDGILHIKEL
jgi:hypothetical protein